MITYQAVDALEHRIFDLLVHAPPTQQGDVVCIRQTVEVKVFIHHDTMRASKGAFKAEIDDIVEQCG